MAKSHCPPRSSSTRSFHKQYIAIEFARPSRLTATKPPPMHGRMVDADGALSHHLLEIPKTERIGHIPSHAQQHHIQRIMKPLQNLGNACSKGRSWCRDLLHREPKQSL